MNHRSKDQRLEYLVKHRLDPVSLAFWKKGINLKDHPMISEYLQILQKPITHSKTKALVSNLTIPIENTSGTKNTISIHNSLIPSDKPQVNLMARSHESVKAQVDSTYRLKRAHKFIMLQLLLFFFTWLLLIGKPRIRPIV